MAVPGAYNALFGMIEGYQQHQEKAAAQETQKKQTNLRMILPLLFQQAEQGNVGLVADKGLQTYLKSQGVDPALGEFFSKMAQQSKEKNAPREAMRNLIMQMMGSGGLGGLGGGGGGETPAPTASPPASRLGALRGAAPSSAGGALAGVEPRAGGAPGGALGGAAQSISAGGLGDLGRAPAPPPQQQVRDVGGTNPNLVMSEQLSKWSVALSLSGDSEGAQAMSQASSLLLRNVEARNMMRKLQTDEEQLDSLRGNRKFARRQAQLETDIARRTTALRLGITSFPHDPAAGVNAFMAYLENGNSAKIRALHKKQRTGTGGAVSNLSVKQQQHYLKNIVNMANSNTHVSAMLANSANEPDKKTLKGIQESKRLITNALMELSTAEGKQGHVATPQELSRVITEGAYIPLTNKGYMTNWYSVRKAADVAATLLGTGSAKAGQEHAAWEIHVEALQAADVPVDDTGGIWGTWDLKDGSITLQFVSKEVGPGKNKLFPKITGTGIYANVQASRQSGQPGTPPVSKAFED